MSILLLRGREKSFLCGAVQIFDLGNSAHARDAREQGARSVPCERLRPTAFAVGVPRGIGVRR